MEEIGDTWLVGDAASEEKQDTLKEKSNELSLNVDDLRHLLEIEEKRLLDLEEIRLKLHSEIGKLSEEIAEEKIKYRQVIDGIIEEGNTITEMCFPVMDVEAQEASNMLDEIMRTPKPSKNDYMDVIRDYLEQKRLQNEMTTKPLQKEPEDDVASN